MPALPLTTAIVTYGHTKALKDGTVHSERVVFEHARPTTVVVTTPNREYNVRFPSLPAGRMRHRDHRFEWSRAEFRDWAARVAASHGYTTRFLPVGRDDPEVGSPTQMAVFSR